MPRCSSCRFLLLLAQFSFFNTHRRISSIFFLSNMRMYAAAGEQQPYQTKQGSCREDPPAEVSIDHFDTIYIYIEKERETHTHIHFPVFVRSQNNIRFQVQMPIDLLSFDFSFRLSFFHSTARNVDSRHITRYLY